MPIMANRLKSNMLLKMEKENENKRKVKSMNKERLPANGKHQETVWERLSRVKKSASNEGSILAGSKSRILMQAKSSHRMYAGRSTAQRSAKKPLTPNTNLNRRVVEKKSARRFKPSRITYTQSLEPEECAYGCRQQKSVKEILTARSICNSKSSSDGSKSSGKKLIYPLELCDHLIVPSMHMCDPDTIGSSFEQGIESIDSLDEYVVAPLMPVPTKESLNLSANIAANFRCMLEEKNKEMEPEDIAVIKNVVKTDERHRQLQREDSKLFKDILKTQLKEIIRQEAVVKSALNKLDEPDNSSSTIAMVTSAIAPDALHKKPQVDVIFKNVPTLEKEIIILKALGEKLEATLKRTVSQNDFNVSDLNKMATAIANQWHSCWPLEELNAVSELSVFGEWRSMGVVCEFRMVQKTIVELKEQASHHFYLPSNKDNTELKRTSFKRLKENPDLLMRYLKPKNTLVPFNVLDHDPVFFNSYIYNATSIVNLDSSESNSTTLDNNVHDIDIMPLVSSPVTKVVMRADSKLSGTCLGYNYLPEQEPLKIEEIKNPSQATLRCSATPEGAPSPSNVEGAQNAENANIEKVNDENVDAECVKTEQVQRTNDKVERNIFEAPVRGKKRRRIRRRITPMQLDKPFEPKNSLFKTILVGSVQVSVFLLLIMAITYPDAKC